MIKFIFCLVGLSVVAACGRPPAGAPKNDVEPITLRSFKAGDIRFTNNKIFLWKENATPEQVASALAIAREIDDLDTQAIPLNRHHSDLKQSLDPLKDLLRQMNAEYQFTKKLFDDATADSAACQQNKAAKNAALKLEREKLPIDDVAVNRLLLELATLEGQSTDVAKVLTKVKPRKTLIEGKLMAINKNVAPLQAALDDVDGRRAAISVAGQGKVSDITKVVDWFDNPPTSIVFQFGLPGEISGSITGWDLGDGVGPRQFSTESVAHDLPTMGNITYDSQGGVYDFDVWVRENAAAPNVRETYHFHVARTKYDAPDGRIFVGGEITRKDGSGEIRRGIAQFVDRNN